MRPGANCCLPMIPGKPCNVWVRKLRDCVPHVWCFWGTVFTTTGRARGWLVKIWRCWRPPLAGLAGDIADVLHLDSLTLRHEPLPGLQPGEVSGHLHPVARVAGRGRAVRRRCFATDGSRLVMPAFGAYAGGLNLLDKAWRGLFSRQLFAAVLGVERVLCISLPDLIGD
jgi:hypothetical protein